MEVVQIRERVETDSRTPVQVIQIGSPGARGAEGDPGPAGPQGPAGTSGATSYVHTQVTPDTVWHIEHNLGYKPGGIHVEDSAGEDWVGDPEHIDVNTLEITFSAAFGGTAYLS